MKFNPIQRIIGTSLASTGPSSFFTVTSSSVTFVAASKIPPSATCITLAFNPVFSVVEPTSKSSEGRMGSPLNIRPSLASKRMRRFHDVGAMVIDVGLVIRDQLILGRGI